MVLTVTRKQDLLSSSDERSMDPQVPPVQALPRKERKAGTHKSPSAAPTAAPPSVESVISGSRSIQQREDAIRHLQAHISLQQQALLEQKKALGLSKQRQESLIRQAAENRASRLPSSVASPSPSIASPGARQIGRSSWFSPLQTRWKPRFASDTPSTPDQREKARFRVLGLLGEGSFGSVHLVEEHATGLTFALKALRRSFNAADGEDASQEERRQKELASERSVLARVNHPFLVRLHRSFSDKTFVYLVLDACLGGELGDLLQERGKLGEATVRFFGACLVLGLQHLHSMNIVHCDLKPENILIDTRGYLKITDYGNSKELSDGLVVTTVGTPPYCAAEILRREAHGTGVDMWALGCVLYEMATGVTPFADVMPLDNTVGVLSNEANTGGATNARDSDRCVKTTLRDRIIKGLWAPPPHLSRQLADAIKLLLHPKPEQRIGAAELREHCFFEGVLWDLMEVGDPVVVVPVEIVPAVKDNRDLSNFKVQKVHSELISGCESCRR